VVDKKVRTIDDEVQVVDDTVKAAVNIVIDGAQLLFSTSHPHCPKYFNA
jgi:hypothetical protein